MEPNAPELSENKTGHSVGCFWVIVFIIGLGWFLYHLWDNYKYGEKDPFWQGTQTLQVCKTPYYSSKECYKLNVTLIDKKTAQIYFPDGGYKVTHNITCYFSTILNGPRFVFCRSWDNGGQQWDFLPVWVYD